MSRPLLLLAHGAGLGSASPWMTRWAGYLAELGVVVPFDYPYMRAGKKRPDRHPVLLQAHADALADTLETHGEHPAVLIGKSMGSRIGCHLANEPGAGDAVRAVVCLGYPLVGFGKTRKVRDEVLLALRQPILFVQGTRDRLGPLDLLEEVRSRMTAKNELFVVEGGDHSLHLRKTDLKTRGITQEQADQAAVSAIGAFLARQVP
jgi:predicted alpha/beta-hydrolase family hydrolase